MAPAPTSPAPRRLSFALLAIAGCAGAHRGPAAPSTEADAAASPACLPAHEAAAEAPAPTLALPKAPPALLLAHARLIDGTGAAPRADVSVLVQDGRVAKIDAKIDPPPGARVVDLGGRTLLPGFIDAHTHLTFDPPPSYAEGVARDMAESDADRVLRGVSNARATLLAGFTTVRNVGGTFADRSLRDAIREGRVLGPRMLVANHSIGITGGHCDESNALRPGIFGDEVDYRSGVGDGPDELRKAVRYQVKHGADVIKICATGGVLSQGDGVGAPQLTEAEMRTIVEEATRAERKVAAHAHGNLGIREAVRAGVHSIEHGSILDRATVTMMKRKGVVLVPTTYVGRYVVEQADAGALSDDSARKAREIAPKMQASFKLALGAGVTIALGSDAGVFPHGENAKEFVTMVELGMSPMDAIVAGTQAATRLLGLSDVGTLAPGKRADLVVVDGDPLADIHALLAPVLVVKEGAIVRDELGAGPAATPTAAAAR